MADYRVNLEIFAGPMDLLLYLVRKDEVDIYDIPIANITNQYLQYIEMLKSLDMDLAGDFLVMAATLMQIKSAMLLPRAEPEAMEEGDIEDPRAELIRQLLEYKKFKDAANLLSDAAEIQKERHARPDSIIEGLKPETEPELDIEQVSVWDLLEAFDSIIKATGGVRDISHIKDDTPIDLYQIQILGRLQDEGPMVFERLFEGRDERIVLVGLFLALLELIREGLVWAEQDESSKSVYLKALTEEPADEAVKKAVVAFKEEEEKKPQIPIQEIETKGSVNQESGQKYEKVEPTEQQEN
jgi:segregation and condensation protein A